MIDPDDPHAATATLTLGGAGTAAVAPLHGRGAPARDIFEFGRALGVGGLDPVAPAAAGDLWHPRSFLAPIDENRPGLDSAPRRVEATVAGLLARGLPVGRIAPLGYDPGRLDGVPALRGPGGVLFEVAAAGPGFAVDEPARPPGSDPRPDFPRRGGPSVPLSGRRG